jgi:hypothetical protein
LLSLPIIDLYHIDDVYLEKITDEVLVQHPQVRYLFAFDNSNITNISHLKMLEVLDASWGCGICDQGLRKIKAIDITGNKKITPTNNLADHIRDAIRGEEINIEKMIGSS